MGQIEEDVPLSSIKPESEAKHSRSIDWKVVKKLAEKLYKRGDVKDNPRDVSSGDESADEVCTISNIRIN